jgi:predicted secreted hydrolase
MDQKAEFHGSRRNRILWALRLVALSVCILPFVAGAAEYREALPGYTYQFPRDHFEHEDFRTEWWYYTGNVNAGEGERFGFELVFFRQGARHESVNKSAWVAQNVYLAHAAFTDAKGKRFWYEERLNRSGPGIAGASFAQHKVWNGNWSSTWDGEKQTLDAVAEHFRFHLQLAPEKAFVIHGENGVSQKAEGRGRASHYVSFPRLKVSGTLNGRAVSGKAWMDHEWFTEQLAADQVGWDWFSVQLDNGTELMLFELRRQDGSIDPYSSGTFIDMDGQARHLRREEFSLEPLKYWQKYPVQWRLRVPSLGVDLTCRAVLPDQVLRTKGGPSYWEGAVDYSGSQSGVGYLEMTGYEGRVRF